MFDAGELPALTLSLQKDQQSNYSTFFSEARSLEEEQSLDIFVLTICHNLQREDITKLATEASHCLGILHRAKAFLSQTDKAFMQSSM